MLYPWVQLLKWEGIAPFGPNLAADHAQSMRANTFVPVPYVLFVVESSRPERGWTRFVLRDPTGTVPAGTRDSDVAAKLVVGAAVKLTNVHSPLFLNNTRAALSEAGRRVVQVRLVPDSAFCGRLGIVIAWENLGRVVAPKSKPVPRFDLLASHFFGREQTLTRAHRCIKRVRRASHTRTTYRRSRKPRRSRSMRRWRA
jgi:hypothetical protein